MYCWSEVGAKLIGIVQSLLTVCRLLGVNPSNYLIDVRQRIDHHPASLVEELTLRF